MKLKREIAFEPVEVCVCVCVCGGGGGGGGLSCVSKCIIADWGVCGRSLYPVDSIPSQALTILHCQETDIDGTACNNFSPDPAIYFPQSQRIPAYRA